LSLVAGQRFHGDEAIYGYWAQLLSSGQDPLLLSVPLDKPPLFFYLLAGVFGLFGPSEIAARLISEAASLATVVLTYKLGCRLYGRSEALLATAVMALSPFNILFAPTAFTDPLMVALIVAAMNLVTAGRWGWAGLVTGLAVATKQQGILFAPLVAATGWLVSENRTRRWGLVRAGLGFLGVAQGVVGWDALRWRVRASFWEQSAVSHGPLQLVHWWELGERLADWSKLLSHLFGSPVLNAILLLGVPLLLWRSLRKTGISDRRFGADWLLAGFGAFFILFHWLFSFSAWDRYLLGLVPLASLLLARVVREGSRAGRSIARQKLPLRRASQAIHGKHVHLTALALVILLASPAAQAVTGGYAIGGDHGVYQGLEKVVAFFRHEVPTDSVVWHRYLGWHYFHYLFGSPLDLRWYAESEILAVQASQTRDVPNYTVFPSWEKEGEVETRAALETFGLGLLPEYHAWREDGSLAFTVYRIVAADAQPGVTWMPKGP
jgi:hypothetical protein